MTNLIRLLRRNPKKRTVLDQAIEAWRATVPGPTTLSDAARKRILNESRALRVSRRSPAPALALFTPTRRLALATVLPLLGATLLFSGLLIRHERVGEDPALRAPRVEVLKDGVDVVFVIANGGRSHQVSRSTRPDRGGEVFRTTTGEFRDRLESEAKLVFYRID